ncbi:MAG: hypothetical protein IJ542_02855 [Clostridia bacterium]|nr:hypothetical protein [Clostridia bacterium]
MENQNKTKYYYDKEQDEFIVKTVLEDYKKRQEERRNQELVWELNINYMIGNQYSCISPRGEIEPTEKNFYWESREVFNHIAPIIETRLSKLSKVRPTASVRPSGTEQSDVYCAKLSKSILSNIFNKSNMSELISMATMWSEITGTSFYKVCWNTDLGDTIAVSDKGEIKAGDVDISVCSPYEIFPDSCANANVDDCASIIHARSYPASYVNEVYGIKETGKDIDSLVFDEMSYRSGIAGRSNVTKLTHVKKHDNVLVIERYEKPSKKTPKGRLTIVAGESLVYDGDLPFCVASNGKRGYPFVKQVSSAQIGSFWGTSIIERCIPVQRAYNALKNRKHEFIARLSAGVLAVEDGSVDVDNLEDEGLAPGKILVYRAGSEKPTFMDAGSVPKEISDEEEKLLAEFNILSGVSEIMRDSKLPTAVSSGSAITLLIQQDETRLSATAEYIRTAVKEIAEKTIRLYKQFANSKRLSRIADENGAIEVYYWTGAELSSDDVVLDTTNELTESAVQKQSLLLELYSKGLLSDENGKISNRTRVKILESLGFASWENSQDISIMHSKKAIKENLNIEEVESPLEVDDHKIHIEEHTRFLISDESKKFSDEHNQKILEHIKQHKKLLNGE